MCVKIRGGGLHYVKVCATMMYDYGELKAPLSVFVLQKRFVNAYLFG